MPDFWKILLSSVGFSTFLCGVLCFLFREWISARLRKSIQHEYDIKLEGYKAGYQKFLAENEIRFHNWHKEEANAIKVVFGDVAELVHNLYFLYDLELNEQWNATPDIKERCRKETIDKFVQNTMNRRDKWLKVRLYLKDGEDKKVNEFYQKAGKIFAMYAQALKQNNLKLLLNDGVVRLKELDDFMNAIRHCFQDALCGMGKKDS